MMQVPLPQQRGSSLIWNSRPSLQATSWLNKWPHSGEAAIHRNDLAGQAGRAIAEQPDHHVSHGSAVCTPPSGYWRAAPSRIAGTFSMPAVIGVSVMPGATALMRTPCAA